MSRCRICGAKSDRGTCDPCAVRVQRYREMSETIGTRVRVVKIKRGGKREDIC